MGSFLEPCPLKLNMNISNKILSGRGDVNKDYLRAALKHFKDYFLLMLELMKKDLMTLVGVMSGAKSLLYFIGGHNQGENV